MQERPILFTTEMVRAILEGRKSQTRRIVKPQPPLPHLGYMMLANGLATLCGPDYPDGDDDDLPCPYGVPGDRLWVRETFLPCRHSGTACKPSEATYVCFRDGAQRFEKNGKTFEWTCENPPDWTGRKFSPSIHMPRWASRLTIDLLAVRVERLLEITEEDAMAEGAPCIDNPDYDDEDPADDEPQTHIAGFADLWVKINGQESWDANPWVWALTFKVVSQTASTPGQPAVPASR